MAYEVVLMGRAEGALRALLSSRLGDGAIHDDDDTLRLTLPDKSALMAVLEQLHELNIAVESVQHVESSYARAGADDLPPGHGEGAHPAAVEERRLGACHLGRHGRFHGLRERRLLRRSDRDPTQAMSVLARGPIFTASSGPCTHGPR